MNRTYHLSITIILLFVCSNFIVLVSAKSDQFKINDKNEYRLMKILGNNQGISYLAVDSEQNIYVADTINNCVNVLGKNKN